MIQKLVWQDIPFSPGTVTTVTPCRYTLDDMGFVHYKGYFILTAGLTAPTDTIVLATLPVDIRPPLNTFVTSSCITATDRGIRYAFLGAGGFSIGIVNDSANISAGAYFSLDGITYCVD